MSKPVQDSLLAVKSAKQEVNKLLTGTEHSLQILEINSLFNRLETRLVFMGAVTEHELVTKENDPFPPITNFMGEEIKYAQPIKASDLRPDEVAKRIFLEKVDKLWKALPDMEALEVLKNYSIPEDVTVLRGVAKRAGVADFADRELTVAFVDDIALAIEIKNDAEATKNKINDQLKNQPVKVLITQEMISKDPDLKKWNAKPGDELETRGDGKKKLIRAAA